MNRHKVPDDQALKHDVKTRITSGELQRLQQLLASTHYRTMSEMLRAIICDGQIKTVTVDESLDVVMEQLVVLKRELGAIGNNLNQIARALNTDTVKGRQSVPIVAMIGHIKELGAKLATTHDLIGRLSGKWLDN